MNREKNVSRGQTALAAVGFLAVIAAIGGSALAVGLVPVGFGLMAGAGGLFVGMLFVVRDLLHQWLSITIITALIFGAGLSQLFFLEGGAISQQVVIANILTLIGATTAQAVWFTWSRRRAERFSREFDVGSWWWLHTVLISSLLFGVTLQSLLFLAFAPQVYTSTSLFWGAVLLKTYGVALTVTASVVGAFLFNRRESRASRATMMDPAYAPVVGIRSRSRVA